MELIKQKIKENKEMIIDYLLILLLAICTCTMYFKFHAITDTYWDIQIGYKEFGKIALSDGRIINFILLNLAGLINIPMVKYEVIVHIVATIINTISVYLIYNYIRKAKNVKNKYLLLIGSFLIIFNPMNIEHYAYFENIVMSLSMLLCTSIAIDLNKEKNWYILKSVVMLIIAVFSYQGTLNLFIALTFLFMFLKEDKTKKQCIRIVVKMILLIIIALTITFLSIVIINHIMQREQDRIGNLSIFSIKTIYNIVYFIAKSITAGNHGLFARYLIANTIIATILILANQNKKIAKYIEIILISSSCCIIPAFFQKNIAISARMSCSIGAIMGSSIIYLIVNADLNNKIVNYLIRTLTIILLGINTFNYWNVGIMNHKTMKCEEELAKKIGQVINEYEKKNNVIIENVAFYKNNNSSSTFLDMPNNTFNKKSILCSYSNLHCLNYYLNKNYKEANTDNKIYRENFQNYNSKSFRKEQIIFINNTAHILIL